MDRRRFLKTSTVALVAAAFPELAVAARQGRGKFEELPGGVGIFTSRGGTIGFLAEANGLVVVDTQFPDTAQACLKGLRERSTQPIEVLLNTHHHGDHTRGNGVFRRQAKLHVAHVAVPRLQRVQAKERRWREPVVASTTFEKEWHGKVGGETVRARYRGPAHTLGDAAITFERADVVHLGDLVFHEMHPFIDPPGGASMVNWPRAIEAELKRHGARTRYIFGHGRGNRVTGGKAEALRFRDYLDAVVSTVSVALKRGRERDEILAIDELKGFENYRANGPRMCLKRSLQCTIDELTDPRRHRPLPGETGVGATPESGGGRTDGPGGR